MYLKKVLFFLFLLLTSVKTSLAQIDSIQRINGVEVKASKTIPSLRSTQKTDSASFLKTSSYNVADAIRNFAGVNIKDYGGIGGLKTVSVRSLGANHTGVQIDGINIGDAQTGQIDLGRLMLDNIESISLHQAQPDDMLSNARSYSAASLVSIKTKVPSFDVGRASKVILKYTSGSFGLINPFLQYNQKISDSWTLSFNTSLQKAKGDYKYQVIGDGSDTLSTRQNAEISNVLLDGALRGKLGKDGLLELRMNYLDSERGLPSAVIYYNPTGKQKLWNNDFYSQAKYTKKLNKQWDLLISTKFSRNYTRYNDPEYLNQQGELDNKYTQKEYYLSGATTFKPSNNLTFNYATDVAITTLYTNLYQYAYPTRTTLIQVLGGRFKQNKFTLEGNLLSNYIKEKVKTGRTSPERLMFSPTVSLAYEVNSSLILRSFIKDIFRYPTFNDLYYTNFGNRKLNPEKVKQYNVGLLYQKYTPSKFNSFSISSDFYYNQITDKIISLPNKDLFIWTMYNLDKVEIFGADISTFLSFDVNESSAIQTRVNYTYQSAVDKTDPTSSVYNNQIPYTPKHTVSFNAGFEKEKWGLFYNQIFSSGRYYLGDNKPEYFVDGFSVSDVSGNYKTQIYTKPVIFAAELNNIFNLNYAIVRSFPMPGISFRLTIKTII